MQLKYTKLFVLSLLAMVLGFGVIAQAQNTPEASAERRDNPDAVINDANSLSFSARSSTSNVSYNRAAAVNWARSNNYNDGSFRGTSAGRYCTNLVASALAAGGLNTNPSWSGNGQLVRWMQQNPNSWEFKQNVSGLEPGDFILYSDNPNAPSNWSYIDPTHGWSLWLHSVLYLGNNQVASWNAERLNLPYNAYTDMPYHRYVHIKTEGGNSGGGTTPDWDVSSTQDMGTMNAGTDYTRTIPADTAHVWNINVTTMPFKVDLQQRSDSTGMNHSLYLVNSAGNVVMRTRPHVDSGRNVLYHDNIPTGNYQIVVVPDDATATGRYNLTLWFTTYLLASADWPSSVHSTTAVSSVADWYFTCDSRCNPGYLEYTREDGNVVWEYEIRQRGGTAILATGTIDDDLERIPINRSGGTFDLKLRRVSGSGSYTLRIYPGTPAPEAFEVEVSPATIEVYLGDSVSLNLATDNVQNAPNGGIKALELACDVDEPIVTGIEINIGDLFSGAAIERVLNVPSFAPATTFHYLASEGAGQPAVDQDGIALEVVYEAQSAGQTDLICTVVRAVDGSDNLIEVDYVGATIIVIGNGRIEGTLQLSVADDHSGIDVLLLDENGNEVASTTTDSDGNFLLEDVRPGPGSYILEADTAGYIAVATENSLSVEGEATSTMPQATLLPGDVNGDNTNDLLDVTQFAADYASQQSNSTLAYDFDRSGDTSLFDFFTLVQNLDVVGPTSWD